MNQSKFHRRRDSNTPVHKRNKPRRYRPFPYFRIAKMWADGMTIARIAKAIGRIDKDNPRDPYHSLRNCLHRMHKGYTSANGRRVRLPHRVSKKTIRAARRAGLRAAA